MKYISKKLVCILLCFALTVSNICVFANVQTIVPVEEYMYDVKTIYVDDDLEGNTAHKISQTLTASNTASESDTNNTAFKRAGWDSIEVIPAGSFINADKIVVSFDVKPQGTSFSEAVAGGSFDKTKRSFVGFGIYAGGSGETGKLGQFSASTLDSTTDETLKGWISWGKGANIVAPQTNAENNGYVRVTAVYERVKDDGADTYKVYMRSLTFNGKEVLTDALKEGYSEAANWWSDAKNVTLKIQNRTGVAAIDNYYDNFLVYEPEDFKIKNLEYADDYMSAKANLTLGAKLDEDLKVNLITEDGTNAINIETGESKKELVLDFDNELDLENESYYLLIDGLKSLTGDVLEGEKYLVSKKYADVKNVSASKTTTEVTGEFYIDALEDKTVYAVMSVWNENNCIDFTVQPVILDSALGDVPVEVEMVLADTTNADRAQMYFVDSIKNMKIISDIADLELN